MMISTRGRYALRVMLDLAAHDADGYIPLKEIAHRQESSTLTVSPLTSSSPFDIYSSIPPGKAHVLI